MGFSTPYSLGWNHSLCFSHYSSHGSPVVLLLYVAVKKGGFNLEVQHLLHKRISLLALKNQVIFLLCHLIYLEYYRLPPDDGL
jgi:hypothetical protein